MEGSSTLTCKSVHGWDVWVYKDTGESEAPQKMLQARGGIHWEGSMAVTALVVCLPGKFSELSPSHLGGAVTAPTACDVFCGLTTMCL